MKIKHTFFSENLHAKVLSPSESNHALRVLRLRENDFFYLVDGKGKKGTCYIKHIKRKQVEYEIEAIEKEEFSGPSITIGIGLPKSKDRTNFLIEKLVEVGIKTILPIQTENAEKSVIKLDKLKAQAISGMKQSGNLFLPEISSQIKLVDVITDSKIYGGKYIAHCNTDAEKKPLKEVYTKHESVLILVGPEGDFTPEEVILAKENGFSPVSLGDKRLRTETAGILSCHTFHVLY